MIIATLTGDGFTQDMYQRLRQGVEWDTEPVGGWIVHAVYWDDSCGIHMTTYGNQQSTTGQDSRRVSGLS